MNRKKIEHLCSYAAIVTLGIMSLGGILGIVDAIFRLGIYSPRNERILYFLLGLGTILIVGSVMVSVMINVGIAADKMIDIDQKIGSIDASSQKVSANMDKVLSLIEFLIPGARLRGGK